MDYFEFSWLPDVILTDFVSVKLREGTMFEPSIMDQFRTYNENDPTFKVTDDLKTAWFSFLLEFCPCVSYEWTNYLSHLSTDHHPGFLGYLSASDEAFTIWSINLKYERVKKEVEDEKKIMPMRRKESAKRQEHMTVERRLTLM